MVCNRCIKVVRQELTKAGIDFIRVDLGTIYRQHILSDKEKEKLIQVLEKEGFEVIEEREAKIINQIKSLLLEHIQYGKGNAQNFSDFLVSSIGMEYSQMSKLFSNAENKSIENYSIHLKIERVKELLTYNELSLSEISYELNYSSPQHLSRQFKQVTGLTPTTFKKIGKRKKLDTI